MKTWCGYSLEHDGDREAISKVVLGNYLYAIRTKPNRIYNGQNLYDTLYRDCMRWLKEIVET